MSTTVAVRLPRKVRRILYALDLAGRPLTPVQLCRITCHGPGVIYPVIDRLLKAGWVEQGALKHSYQLTDHGRRAIGSTRRSSMNNQAATEATENANAIATEIYRRMERLEELRSESAPRESVVENVRGEILGLQGALGIVLGGTVPGDSADRLAKAYCTEWLKAKAARG